MLSAHTESVMFHSSAENNVWSQEAQSCLCNTEWKKVSFHFRKHGVLTENFNKEVHKSSTFSQRCGNPLEACHLFCSACIRTLVAEIKAVCRLEMLFNFHSCWKLLVLQPHSCVNVKHHLIKNLCCTSLTESRVVQRAAVWSNSMSAFLIHACPIFTDTWGMPLLNSGVTFQLHCDTFCM